MSSSYMYDLYGRKRTSQTQTAVDAPMPYQVASESSTDSSGNKVVTRYTRFSGGEDKVGMWREITIFAAGTNDILSYTHEFGVSKWDDRADQNVRWVPINECWDYNN